MLGQFRHRERTAGKPTTPTTPSTPDVHDPSLPLRRRWLAIALALSFLLIPSLSTSRSEAATATSACATAVPLRKANCLSTTPVGHRGREYSPATTNENTIAALAVDGNVH